MEKCTCQQALLLLLLLPPAHCFFPVPVPGADLGATCSASGYSDPGSGLQQTRAQRPGDTISLVRQVQTNTDTVFSKSGYTTSMETSSDSFSLETVRIKAPCSTVHEFLFCTFTLKLHNKPMSSSFYFQTCFCHLSIITVTSSRLHNEVRGLKLRLQHDLT